MKKKTEWPEMPMEFPNDHKHVKMFIEESRRLNVLGAKWMNCRRRNPVAAQKAFENGWAYALAAAWLRAKIKGEL